MKIKLSELRQMVKSVIKEETPASAVNKYPTPVTKKFLDKSGKPFNVTVTQEYLTPNGLIIIKTVEGIPLTFDCKNKQFYTESRVDMNINKSIVSNLEYTKELQSRFCANINKIYPAGGGTPTGGGSGATSSGGLGASAEKVGALIQKVRFYDNETEKSTAGDLVLNITQTYVDKDSTKVILETDKGNYTHYCKDKFIKHIGGMYGSTPAMQMLKTPMYNKSYIDKLKALYCTSSSGGSSVINVGTHSQTNQKQPMNVAESKLRQIVKSIIKEELTSQPAAKPVNYNGHTYTGEMQGGKPHGTGKLVYNSQQMIRTNDPKRRMANAEDYFEGEFKNGEPTFGKFFNKAANKLVHIDFGG